MERMTTADTFNRPDEQGSRPRQSFAGDGDSCSRKSMNVGSTEGLACLAGGAALALLGVTRRSLGGLALGVLGGGLLYRGVTRNCALYSALGIDTNCEASEARA